MRVNIYSQELTNEIGMLAKKSNTTIEYAAVRLYLHSSPLLHHTAEDDDRSAITFWLPNSTERKEDLAKTFEQMAKAVRSFGLKDLVP